MSTFVYSFENVTATVNGLKVTGFWEGDNAIEVAPNADNATLMVGADGDATASYTADDSVTLTLRLKADSPMNAILENYHRRARAGGFGGGFPISVRNTSNGEGGAAAEAHIMRAPNRQFGTNATVREWVLGANAWEWTPISYVRP
jgi:hypothetical protein